MFNRPLYVLKSREIGRDQETSFEKEKWLIIFIAEDMGPVTKIESKRKRKEEKKREQLLAKTTTTKKVQL